MREGGKENEESGSVGVFFSFFSSFSPDLAAAEEEVEERQLFFPCALFACKRRSFVSCLLGFFCCSEISEE